MISSKNSDSTVDRNTVLPVSVLLVVTMAGCYSLIEPPSPKVDVPAAFSTKGKHDVPTRWWKVLGDTVLDNLVEASMEGNLDLMAAWDRLRQARATMDKSRSEFFPSINLSAGGERSINSVEGTGRVYSTDYSGGLSLSWEVDLWGRIKSGYYAASLDAEARREDTRAAAMSLSGRVASAWYRIVELRGLLKILDNQEQTNRELVEIITLKFRKGDASATDVLQQKQVLESTEAARQRAAENLELAVHALAILLGREPGRYNAPEGEVFPELPPMPGGGLPSDWIKARPDIRAAELRVRAADNRTAEAIADKYPKLTIGANGQATSERIRNLLDNWIADLAADLVAPLFDAGLREAEVARSRARSAELLHDYSGTLLTALGEVEDAVAREIRREKYLESLVKQKDLLKKTVNQVKINYLKGAESYVSFLTALVSYQRLQTECVTAHRELVDARIELYRGLGRGWNVEEPTLPVRRVRGPAERAASLLKPGKAEETE